MSKTATITADVLEFDLDGTLVYTTAVVERLWTEISTKHGVDPVVILNVSHGVRTSDILEKYFPNVDNTDNKAVDQFERDIPDKHGDLVEIIPGTVELLNALNKDRWAIVTSGGKYIAHSWFNGILKDVQKPNVFITAEMVSNGKPDPEGYLKAEKLLRENLGLTGNGTKIVFEDAPQGIKAGVASGAIVIGIKNANDAKPLYDAGATYVVQDLRNVKVIDGDKVTIEVTYE